MCVERIGLDPSLQLQKRVSIITHLEDASEAILCQVANFQDLQVWRNMPKAKFAHYNVINNYRRLRGFIQGGRQKVLGARVEASIGRKRRPVKIERHGAVKVCDATDAMREGWRREGRSGQTRDIGSRMSPSSRRQLHTAVCRGRRRPKETSSERLDREKDKVCRSVMDSESEDGIC